MTMFLDLGYHPLGIQPSENVLRGYRMKGVLKDGFYLGEYMFLLLKHF